MAETLAAAPRFTNAMEEITRSTGDFSGEQRVVTARIGTAAKGKEVQQAMTVAAESAVLWNSYADRLEPIVDRELIPSALSVEKGVVATRRLSALGRPSGAQGLEETIGSLASVSGRTAHQIDAASGAIRQLSQISSPLRSAGDRLAGILDRISATFERIAGLTAMPGSRQGG